MYRFPNATGQVGVFKTGSPNYIDVSAGAALAKCVTFGAQATADSWVAGDFIGVRIEKDDSNYQVWAASWNPTTSRLEMAVLEESNGTIADDANVNVWACATAVTLSYSLKIPERTEWVIDNNLTRTLTDADSGKNIGFTNGSAVAVTVDASTSVGFQCVVWQLGAGTVTISRGGSDTINGGTAGIDTPARWKSAFISKYQSTAVLVGV